MGACGSLRGDRQGPHVYVQGRVDRRNVRPRGVSTHSVEELVKVIGADGPVSEIPWPDVVAAQGRSTM